MRVRVDGEKCQGHNRCFAVASELFELDDYGISVGPLPFGVSNTCQYIF